MGIIGTAGESCEPWGTSLGTAPDSCKPLDTICSDHIYAEITHPVMITINTHKVRTPVSDAEHHHAEPLYYH